MNEHIVWLVVLLAGSNVLTILAVWAHAYVNRQFRNYRATANAIIADLNYEKEYYRIRYEDCKSEDQKPMTKEDKATFFVQLDGYSEQQPAWGDSGVDNH